MNKRKGISLIVLVITILVMIILAGVVVVSLSKNNPIEKAKEATFKQDLAQIGEELEMFIATKIAEMPEFKKQTLQADSKRCTYNDIASPKEKNIFDIIPSLKGTKYKDKLEIIQGVLFYRTPSKKEIAWLDEIGVFYKGIQTGGITVEGDTLVGVSPDYTGALIIPENVKEIREGAFANCSRLTTVLLPEGITEIPDTCFYACTSLSEITLPDSVTRIGREAFKECTSLSKINMPKNLNIIDSSAFSACKLLNNITFNANLRTINKYAFFNCSNLSNLTFVEGLTTIGQEAFERTALNSVRLPESLTTLGYAAFIKCPNLNDIYIGSKVNDMGGSIVRECPNITKVEISQLNTKYFAEGNIVYEKNSDNSLTLLFAPNNLASANINSRTKVIKAEAFLMNNKITSIIIPEGVEILEHRIFETCNNLQTLTIPSTVKSIGKKLVQSCSNLNTINIVNNKKYTADGGVIYEKNSSGEKVKVISAANVLVNYTMPNTIVGLEESAFASCSKLKQITLSTNPLFQELPREAFHQCGFSSITVPGNVKKIQKNCFSHCTNLTNLVLNEGVEYLSDSIFPNAPIASLHLPSTLKTVFGPTFVFANNLTKITVDENNPYYMAEGNAVYGKTNGVFNGVLIGYGHVSGVLKIKEGVTEIPEYALTQKNNITRIELPTTIKKIGVRGISDCLNLQRVIIPSGIEVIEKEAFKFTPNLSEIIIDKLEGSIQGAPWGATQGIKAVIWK